MILVFPERVFQSVFEAQNAKSRSTVIVKNMDQWNSASENVKRKKKCVHVKLQLKVLVDLNG